MTIPIPSARGLRFFRSILCAMTAASYLVASPVLAQESSSGEADALFRSGLEQMRAGRYETACPMLARSYQLDPLPGALFTEADCEAAWGKAATAIEHYQAFVNALTLLPADRRAKFDERRSLALEKIASLAPLASELTIDVSLAPPASLVVKRNGMALDRAAYGVSKRVDPGQYAVIAEMDGKVVWERRVNLAPGDKARVDVPWLESPKSAPAITPPGPAAGAGGAMTQPSAASGGSTTRTLAYFAGGIGIGGLAAGIITGVIALNEKATIDENCPMRQCNAKGRDAVESARASAMVSTVGFSVGLAGAVGATVLWLTSDRAKKNDEATGGVHPLVMADGRGGMLGLQGSFR